MLTPDVLECLEAIQSYKVKEYCKTYLENIHLKYGKMFDISVASAEIDEELRYVAISFYLLTSDRVTVVYGSKNLNVQQFTNTDTKEVVFINPEPSHLRMSQDGLEIDSIITCKLDWIIGRQDVGTILDGYGVTLTSFVEPISFRSQLYPQSYVEPMSF